jgi:hypothetical protein
MLPHFLSHVARPAGWIGGLPLSVRLRQVPVAFAIGYINSTVSWALLAAAALAAVVIALLLIGADRDELTGAGLAAAIAGAVLVIPLGLAALGHDYYVPRALIMAWIPLAVVLGAACTTARARAPGAALAVGVLGVMVYAGIRINSDSQYQRPAWRSVASALGKPSGTRAIVAYDGGYAAVPLALYLHGDALAAGSAAPVMVGEIDVVGAPWQKSPARLGGATRESQQQVGGYLVERFELPKPAQLTPAQIDTTAQRLLPGPAGAAVVVQRPAA